MQLAVAVADFSPAEADQLRRAMGSKRSRDKIEQMRIRLYDGMAANGITGPTADDIYEKIQAFAVVRLRREPLDQLRAARLRIVMAQAALSSRVLCGTDQRPADGFLFTTVTRPRREAARHRGAQTVARGVACDGHARGRARTVAMRLSRRTAAGGTSRARFGCARSAPILPNGSSPAAMPTARTHRWPIWPGESACRRPDGGARDSWRVRLLRRRSP